MSRGLPDGTPDEAILSAEEAEHLFGQASSVATKIAPADADKLRLLVESARIRLAYTHDRHFAVSLSGIRALPHQIEAVYMKMLPQPRLRFLPSAAWWLVYFECHGGVASVERSYH